jgi:hypothetical protein
MCFGAELYSIGGGGGHRNVIVQADKQNTGKVRDNAPCGMLQHVPAYKGWLKTYRHRATRTRMPFPTATGVWEWKSRTKEKERGNANAWLLSVLRPAFSVPGEGNRAKLGRAN